MSKLTVNPDWTLEEAQAEHDKALAACPPRTDNDPTLPLYQWFALKNLEKCHEDFASDKSALTQAIRICANHGLPLPDWAAIAYIRAYDTINNAREKSWDTVLGAPYPKGVNLDATRKRRVLAVAVHNEVNRIIRNSTPVVPRPPLQWAVQALPEIPINSDLFERVGKKFYIGKTLAAEYYYGVKRKMQPKK